MTTKTSKITSTFSHIVMANHAEYDFVVSLATDLACKNIHQADDEVKGVATDILENELSEFIATLPMKSKIVRRFQRFGEDADEYEKEELEEMLSNAMLNARASYSSSNGGDDKMFSEYLVDEINSEIGESPSGDKVTEWSILNDIEGQVKEIITSLEAYYDITLVKDDVLDRVMDECDRKVDEFVRKNDKSTGLDIVSMCGESQYYFAPLSSEIDDGQNKLCIPDFEELGLGGLQPDTATLDLLRMAGISPVEIIKELREEMEHETLIKWDKAAKNDISFVNGAKVANIQDVLDIFEHCGSRGGTPVYVTELSPKSFLNPVDGEDIRLERAGLTMIPDDLDIESPAVVSMEGPVEFPYKPQQMLPTSAFGIDPMKDSSLKPGELISTISPVRIEMEHIRDKLLENEENLGM